MKTVNFLPDWYRRAERDRRQLNVRLALMILLGLVMTGWTFFGRERISQLQAQREELRRQGEIVRNLTADLTRVEGEVRHLENLQLAYRDLGHTVPMSAVLQQIPNNLDEGMALSRVAIDVRPEPVKNSGTPGDSQHPLRFHSTAHIIVVGVAPTDVLIAQFIGRIAANPLFADVSLNYTRTETLRASFVRRFEIQMNVDLDRLAVEEEPVPATPRAQVPEDGHVG